jgi:hypothetical protein
MLEARDFGKLKVEHLAMNGFCNVYKKEEVSIASNSRFTLNP